MSVTVKNHFSMHLNSMGVLVRCQISGLPKVPNQKVWRWSPGICIVNRESNDSHARELELYHEEHKPR